jgi:hypothetical protein
MPRPIGKSNAALPISPPQGRAAAPVLTVAPASAPPGGQALWTPPLQGEWSTNKDGSKSDPVNLYLHGSLDQVTRAFGEAGWTQAKPKSLGETVRYGALAIPGFLERGAVSLWNKLTGRHDHLTNADPLYREVNAMPVDPLYFDGKVQTVAFEKDNNPFGGRHHLRVFSTGKLDAQGQPVWAVAASRDDGLRFDLHRPKTLFLDHTVEPNADLERDTVLRDLRAGGAVRSVEAQAATWPERSPTQLHSEDGRVFDVTLA